ncbi:MAG: hypothetical protein U0736_16430 [Gemmataceae bacterium]
MSTALRHIRFAVVLTLLLVVPACKSKVTKPNFERIKDGMTLEEVTKLLGKGNKETGDGSNVAGQFGVAVMPPTAGNQPDTYTWESQSATITVYFRDNKVIGKRSSGL